MFSHLFRERFLDTPFNGLAVNPDNHEVGHARIFINGTATYRIVVPAYFPIQLGEGH